MLFIYPKGEYHLNIWVSCISPKKFDKSLVTARGFLNSWIRSFSDLISSRSTPAKYPLGMGTWRIIPISNWLVIPIYKQFRPFRREQSYLGDLLTMDINHLLTGMILQVGMATRMITYDMFTKMC